MFVNKAFFPGHHIPIKYEVVNMELQKFSPKFFFMLGKYPLPIFFLKFNLNFFLRYFIGLVLVF